MKYVDGKLGLRLLAAVACIYVVVAIFSYSFFIITGPLITGNAMIDLQKNDSYASQQQEAERASFIRTTHIILIIFVIVLFIWIVAYFFGKRLQREIRGEIPRYKAFRTR